MPYIKANDGRRKTLRNKGTALIAGELNYQIFYSVKHGDYSEQLIRMYVEQFLGNKRNYQKYNDMVGALTLCAKEIKRRLQIGVWKMFKEIIDSYDEEIASYEDTKIVENGEVE